MAMSRQYMLRLLLLGVGFFGFPAGALMVMNHMPAGPGDLPVAGLAVIISALVAIAVSLKSLVGIPEGQAIQRIRNQLVFAVIGFCSFGLWGLVDVLWQWDGGIVEGYWAVTSFVWLQLGGLILMFHAIALVLSVGRRLPVCLRLGLHYAIAAIPLALIWVFLGSVLDGRRFVTMAITVLVLVGFLGAKDFGRFPHFRDKSRYDPLASKIARFLSGEE